MSLPDGSSNTSAHRNSNNLDPLARAELYYGDESAASRRDPKNRTFSAIIEPGGSQHVHIDGFNNRRSSVDALPGQRKFLIPVDATLQALLSREDTDRNQQITIEDSGPKVLSVGTAASEGYKLTDIRGTYMLSSLLQELTLAKDYGRKQIILDEARLSENPCDRLSRFIKDSFWKNLTRKIDGDNVAMVAKDPKDWTADPRPRIYVPRTAPEQFEYYSDIAKAHPHIRLDVQWLAEDVTAEYIRDLNSAPGLLAVGMDKHIGFDGKETLIGKPFIVPGGRFNELYGWDSYMGSLGLLLHDRADLCKSMVENFAFCIEHYGKILNANRTYYLGRSQPPFLTDMTLRVYDKIKHEKGALDFLRLGTLAAIKEYYGCWMAEPRLDERTGLSRYRPIGVGVPPETESTHFLHVLEPYAKKHNMTFKEFVHAYDSGQVKEPELDVYFLHDRAVRESGHDTSYRLEKVAADLATVDLNSCLYKIESDIARIIRSCFSDQLLVPKEFHTKGMKLDQVETSAIWDRRAKRRRLAMDKYMWNEEKGMYFDYNTNKQQITIYESATTFWAMWAGVSTPRQAAAMVIKALPKFELSGGLVSGTEQSRGVISLARPNRQWDYPFGWAPHQILAWIGFQRYGYTEEAQRLAYKWTHMVTKAFVDFSGIVVEKYDLSRPIDPQRVEAEYGNQGADFKGIPREGFGWVNASYILGLSILTAHQRRAIGTLTSWDSFHAATRDLDVTSHDLGSLNPAPQQGIVKPAESHSNHGTYEELMHQGNGHAGNGYAAKPTTSHDPYESMHLSNSHAPVVKVHAAVVQVHAPDGQPGNGHAATGLD